MRQTHILLFLVFAPAVLLAQTLPPTTPPAPAAKADKPSFIPFPIVFSQPETGLGYGLAVLPVFRLGTDAATRKSSARLIA